MLPWCILQSLLLTAAAHAALPPLFAAHEASPLVLRCHEHLLVLLRCVVPRQVLVHTPQLDALKRPLVVPAGIHSTIMSTKAHQSTILIAHMSAP